MAKYEEPIITREFVLAQVPKEGTNMNFIKAHDFKTDDGKQVFLPGHWQNGLLTSNGTIINRHYYGIDRSDLGKKVVASVQLVKKITTDGRVFLLVNILKNKNEDQEATSVLKFFGEKQEVPGNTLSFEVPGSDSIIAFLKIQPKNPA